ncbi:hypothetical protein [Salinimicrobium sediminis]|nr:hypothetical protein [Salinimicrobium sediminis]
MSTYELIEKLEKLDYFSDLFRSGILPPHWLDYKVIYEYYQEQLKKEKLRKQALTNTADEFNVSERTVYIIIQKMKG